MVRNLMFVSANWWKKDNLKKQYTFILNNNIKYNKNIKTAEQ